MVSELTCGQQEPARPVVALSRMPEGSSGTMAGLSGDDLIALKLAEVGFVPGAMIRLVRRAPLGSPLEVEVDGARFSLRAETAASVSVYPHA